MGLGGGDPEELDGAVAVLVLANGFGRFGGESRGAQRGDRVRPVESAEVHRDAEPIGFDGVAGADRHVDQQHPFRAEPSGDAAQQRGVLFWGQMTEHIETDQCVNRGTRQIEPRDVRVNEGRAGSCGAGKLELRAEMSIAVTRWAPCD